MSFLMMLNLLFFWESSCSIAMNRVTILALYPVLKEVEN